MTRIIKFRGHLKASGINIYNIHLFLTPIGVKASLDLINMINLLPSSTKISQKKSDILSDFKGDVLLLEFIVNHLNPIIRYNLEFNENTYTPIKMYNIPILRQKVEDADSLGVYIFKHKSGKLAVGSALSCRDRLQDHLNSFYGHRPKTFLHEWVLENGGIESVRWAPMITYDNIVQKWNSNNFDLPLSIGGYRILQGFGLYIARLLEQCVYSYNKPCLSMYSEDRGIIYFNFSLKPEEMLMGMNNINTYQAWKDKKKTKLLAESNSLNSLADMLGLTVGTIRNNMNWEKGTRILDKDSGKKLWFI